MSLENECKKHNECGFVQYRKSGINPEASPLPENGDCGINKRVCQRLNEENPTNLHEPLPNSHREITVAFPQSAEKQRLKREGVWVSKGY